MTSVNNTPGETISPTETHALDQESSNNNSDNPQQTSELRRLVRSTRGLTMEKSLTSYLTFLGRKEDEPIFLQIIDPREVLRSSATAVANDISTALGLLQTAEGYKSQGDYIVANKVKKGVEHRYEIGRWVPDKKGEGISDKDIAVRRAVYIDADAVRDAGDGPVRGISASKEEAFASTAVVLNIADLFASLLGDQDALAFGMSGNGGHLHLALEDLDPEASEPIVKELLAATSAMFSTSTVKIDTSVSDPKRIAPAFGTMKRKGSSTKERPWRRTWFVSPAIDTGRPVRRLAMEDLQGLVAELNVRLTAEQKAAFEADTKSETTTKKSTSTGTNTNTKDDLFKKANSVPYADVMAKLGIPMSCPGCNETKGSSFYETGNCWHCFRESCLPSSRKKNGNWTCVDAVAKNKSIKNNEAAKLICKEFGIEVRGPGRPKKKLTKDEAIQQAEDVGIIIDDGDDDSILTAVDYDTTTADDNNTTADDSKAKSRPLTDLGNAERLVDRYGDDVRFVGKWGRWIVWDGTRWQNDDVMKIDRRAHDTARRILKEAVCADDDEARASIADWAKQSESKGRIEAMVSMAQSMRGIVPEQLNQSPLRLNCPNGTVDLRTGELLPHRRDDLLTTIAKVEFMKYNPFEAKAWEAFLRRVQPDAEVRAFLQRLIGASVLGEVREHVLPVHNGVGRNGKGTFFETLLFVLDDYGVFVPQELLVDGKGDHPTLLATLYGRRLAVASETEQGDALAISRLKRLTGGDTITCRRMREDWWTYEPTHLIHLQTNHRPRVLDTGLAAWERLMLIEWGVTIPKTERDKTLKAKLRAEASQILGWVVEGAMAYLKHGLNVPASIEAATAKWKAEEDLIGQFLAECCLTWDDHGKPLKAKGVTVDAEWYFVGKTALFAAYSEWCLSAGSKPKGIINFRKELVGRGYIEDRVSEERRWVGLGLRSPIEGHLRDIKLAAALEAV